MGEVKLPFKPDLVIFDLDDCLISHHSAFYDAFRHAACQNSGHRTGLDLARVRRRPPMACGVGGCIT